MASEPIDDLQIKVMVMIGLLTTDLQRNKEKHTLFGIFLLNGYVKITTELCLDLVFDLMPCPLYHLLVVFNT